jgi:transposase
MTNCNIYHMWCYKGYDQLTPTSYGKEGTTIPIAPQASHLRCSECGSPKVIHKGTKSRLLRASQVGHNKKVFFDVDVPIVHCKKCGTQRQIDLKISEPKKSYTKMFSQDVMTMLREMSVSGVARFFSVSWGLICSILHSFLSKKYPRRYYRNLRHIAIDEVSYGHGHGKYVTIVFDLEICDQCL